MKILLYTDNHFCSYSSILRDRGINFSARLENQINSINWLEDLALEHKCSMEINLGDFFDKESLNSEELSALSQIEWAYSIEKFFIVGNHEMGTNDLSYNSTNALSSFIHIVSEPLYYKDDFANIIMLPYILESNRKPLQEYIQAGSIDKSLPTIILTHNDIKGIQYGGFESKIGFELSEIESNCDLCLNGHLHNCEKISDKVILLGNLTGLNFSENASKYGHYAYILDTKTLELEKFENPYAFNFYKLEYPFTEKLKSNAVVSLKVKQSQVDEARDFIANNKNIIKSRITLIPELTNIKDNNKQIISKDHIQQFKDYIMEYVGCDDIVKDELRRL